MDRRMMRSNGGFTLMEILIVVAIIALLVGLVGPRLFGKMGEAKGKAAKAQIELFSTSLDSMRLDTGRYPTTDEGLAALVVKPSGMDNWKGPYLKKEIPMDPWGKPYVYRCPGNHGDFDILSYGLDGKEGGDGENADAVSWK